MAGWLQGNATLITRSDSGIGQGTARLAAFLAAGGADDVIGSTYMMDDKLAQNQGQGA
jgi:hypothetical protein